MANSADPDQKPNVLNLHCLQRPGISRFSRTRVNNCCHTFLFELRFNSSIHNISVTLSCLQDRQGVDKKKDPTPDLASSEARTFMPNDGRAIPPKVSAGGLTILPPTILSHGRQNLTLLFFFISRWIQKF